jgi:hypothetical protein
MHTDCPECASTFEIRNPGSNPASPVECDACGALVRPGAFLCPHCEDALQVNRALLPDGGGLGRCPSCAGLVHVPPLRAVAAAGRPEAPPAAGEPPGVRAARAAAVAFDEAAVAFDEASADDEAVVLEEEEEIEAPPAGASEAATRRLSMEDLAAADLAATRRLAAEDLAAATEEGVEATRRFSAAEILGGSPGGPEAAPIASGPAATPRPEPVARAAPSVSPREPAPEAAADPVATLKLAIPALGTAPRPARSPGAVQARSAGRPRTATAARPAAPGRRRGRRAILGLLLGAAMFGGAGYAAGTLELFAFPPFPFPTFGLPAPAAWPALLALAGALAGALVGSLAAGRR